jgi:hypothetical protein
MRPKYFSKETQKIFMGFGIALIVVASIFGQLLALHTSLQNQEILSGQKIASQNQTQEIQQLKGVVKTLQILVNNQSASLQGEQTVINQIEAELTRICSAVNCNGITFTTVPFTPTTTMPSKHPGTTTSTTTPNTTTRPTIPSTSLPKVPIPTTTTTVVPTPANLLQQISQILQQLGISFDGLQFRNPTFGNRSGTTEFPGR